MTTHQWAIGQRVRNEAEPSLGLGMIVAFPNAWSIQVAFPGAGELRAYNPKNAPLRRFELGVGHRAETRDGRQFRVERVESDADGLLTYVGEGQFVHERDLADASASSDPLQRLVAGELSHHEAFDLRQLGWRLRSETMQSRCRGLLGARVALLPHQLAIAHKVSRREYPRVLLADEVGLGKTIEAGLIYAIMRDWGRADRVLVLTPASLVHQWLVEFYRRFNDLFTVAHAELIPGHAGDTSAAGENPFADASRLIAPLDWLLESGRLEQALDHPWDLVIVDEAHHLGWSREQASPGYRAVEALARQSHGLLLLTATPLRQGLETEFGLLRLVDPDRFADFGRFEAEHAHMREVAGLAKRLADGEDVTEALRALFPEARWDGTPEESLRQLVDRHGTGRVLIRNRREKLGGFPGRRLQLSVLPLPSAWKRAETWPEIIRLKRMLGATASYEDPVTAQADPRWEWALDTIRSLGDAKVLVMASSVEAVKALEKRFRRESGLKVGVFHEELGLVERDRQAAYFADPEGAQVLISSEIGGEGRNFQFCHHLVMVDLPVHPDALEQRIGRLDRIGQTHTIDVHVAVVEATPSQALFAWHQALNVFAAPLTGGEAMFAQQARRLLAVLQAHTPETRDAAMLAAFLAETETVSARHRADVQANVDYLIDLNSFDQALGGSLVDEMRDFDHSLLERCVSGLLEHFGVREEDTADPRLLKIRPGNSMTVDPFPGLRAGGYMATYDRDLALTREDLQFLSPDHPLVEGALSLLLDQGDGRASVALWPNAPERGVRLEFQFLLEAVGPGRLGLPAFLPPTTFTVTLDAFGGACPPVAASGVRLRPLGASIWTQLSGLLHDALPDLLASAESTANAELRPRIDTAVRAARTSLGGEHRRLEELHALGNVPDAELAAHGDKVAETLRCLGDARVSLDAVRVVLLDPGA